MQAGITYCIKPAAFRLLEALVYVFQVNHVNSKAKKPAVSLAGFKLGNFHY
jgi:hypothetical protein